MFTIAWWYMFATYVLIWCAILADASFIYAAIALCLAQVIHFGIEDKNFFSFSCQVRYVLVAILLAGLWEPLDWIYWVPVAGLTVRLTTNYCLLARLVSLLPWNHRESLTGNFFRQTIFSKPTRGIIRPELAGRK